MEKQALKELKSILNDRVYTDKETLLCYSNEPMICENDFLPDVVVLPTSTEEVSEILKIADKYEIPLVPRGAGTNHVGGCFAVKGGIVIHFSRMNRISEVNKTNLSIKAEVGATIEQIQLEAEKAGLFYPPDPSNLKVSTLGGGLALSSSGAGFFKYGSVRDYTLSLTVVMADGSIIKTGSNTLKNVCGYDMTSLFVGSEGTLGIITEATLKLIPKPEYKKIILLYFDSVEDAYEASNNIINAGISPSVMDLLDKTTLETIEDFAPAGFDTTKEACLLIEIDGNKEGVNADIKKVLSAASNVAGSFLPEKKSEEKILFSRRSAFAALSRLKPDVITEDAMVPRDKIPQLIKKIKELSQKYNLHICIMGHIADGNIHPNFALDFRAEKENFEKARDELFRTAIELGGTLSGEHGIGMAKAKYLDMSLDKVSIEYMRKIKKLFDPKNILNPDKMF